jgi:hypothetical protein
LLCTNTAAGILNQLTGLNHLDDFVAKSRAVDILIGIRYVASFPWKYGLGRTVGRRTLPVFFVAFYSSFIPLLFVALSLKM